MGFGWETDRSEMFKNGRDGRILHPILDRMGNAGEYGGGGGADVTRIAESAEPLLKTIV